MNRDLALLSLQDFSVGPCVNLTREVRSWYLVYAYISISGTVNKQQMPDENEPKELYKNL